MSPLVRRQAAYGVAYITPGMLIILMFCIAPIFMTLYYSFTEYNLAQPPDWIALENYVKVLNNTQLRRAVVNTVIYVIITVPLQTLLAMFVANFLAEYLNNRYGRVLRSIIFIPTLASYVAAATVWKVILASRGGLLNEILGIFGVAPINWLGEPTLALICVSLVAVWKSAGYFTIIFYAGIMNISVDVREAALIDGAGPIRTFFTVVIPIMKPTFISVGILQTMWIWNDFLLPYLVLDTTEYKTISIVIQFMKGSYGRVDMGAIMAALIMAVIPVVVFYLSCQKYIIKGVAAGAVKG